VLYVQAAPAGASRPRLQSVAGMGSGGGVPPQTLTMVTVDELTTVATAYALAQFSGPNGIAGPGPGLENAAATAFRLADPASGNARRSAAAVIATRRELLLRPGVSGRSIGSGEDETRYVRDQRPWFRTGRVTRPALASSPGT